MCLSILWDTTSNIKTEEIAKVILTWFCQRWQKSHNESLSTLSQVLPPVQQFLSPRPHLEVKCLNPKAIISFCQIQIYIKKHICKSVDHKTTWHGTVDLASFWGIKEDVPWTWWKRRRRSSVKLWYANQIQPLSISLKRPDLCFEVSNRVLVFLVSKKSVYYCVVFFFSW